MGHGQTKEQPAKPVYAENLGFGALDCTNQATYRRTNCIEPNRAAQKLARLIPSSNLSQVYALRVAAICSCSRLILSHAHAHAHAHPHAHEIASSDAAFGNAHRMDPRVRSGHDSQLPRYACVRYVRAAMPAA